jgi:hypothetical protein
MRLLAAAGLLVLSFLACSGDDTNAGGSSSGVSSGAASSGGSGGSSSGASSGGSRIGGASVLPAVCSADCAAKAKECGAPDSAISRVCSSVCVGALEPDQLACLKSSDCSALLGDFRKKCPPSGNATSSGNSAGSTSSGSSSGQVVQRPNAITVTGKIKAADLPTIVAGFWTMTADVDPVTMTPFIQKGSGLPDLTKGQTKIENLPAGCSLSSKPSLGDRGSNYNLIFQFAERAGGACESYMKNIKTKGVEMTVMGAPYSNGGTCTATIRVTP